MKKIISIFISFTCLLLMLFLIIFKKNYFSENENRYLENFPAFTSNCLLSGDYTKKIDLYISDHFPFREQFLSLKTYFLKYIGNIQISDIYIGKDNYLLEKYNKPKSNKSIANILNRFIANNRDSKVEVMFVPTSTYIYSDKLPKRAINYDQKKVINYYKKNINADLIDVIDSLKSHKNKNLYYKTDHHWTMIGAYYAYLDYCNYNNLVPISYNIESINNNFYGTYYSKILDNSLEKDTIYGTNFSNNIKVKYDNKEISNRIYFNNFLNKKDKYNYYFGGNHEIITITNDNISTNNKLLVIKDSYANNFIMFLINHYRQITIIDPRYYNNSINQYINNYQYKNILFLYNLGTLDDDLGIRSINKK